MHTAARTSGTALAAILALSAAPAAAQNTLDAGEVVPLGPWSEDYAEAPPGWSVGNLLDSPAYGAGGEELGEVEDVIFSPEGELVAIVAEVGGFLDLGDHHVSVPWQEVTVRPGATGADIPLSEEGVDEFYADEQDFVDGSVLGEERTVGTDDAVVRRAWRARELIGDYARLTGEGGDAVNYGRVADILVNEGRISATVVSAAGGYGGGLYAYPDYTAADPWYPGANVYDLPYGLDEVEEIRPLNRYDD